MLKVLFSDKVAGLSKRDKTVIGLLCCAALKVMSRIL